MTDTFTCAACGGTFEKDWSDEEALAEGVEKFGDALGDDPAVVCDACYRAMTSVLPVDDYLYLVMCPICGAIPDPSGPKIQDHQCPAPTPIRGR